FVRAQWAGKPLIWHIYPQEEDSHLLKLEAFYDRYLGTGVLSATERSIVWRFVLAWNTGHTLPASETLAELWPQFVAILPALNENAVLWRQQLLQQPDLVTQLRDFVRHLVKYRV
ncbi:MAG: elongation factor P maturation arginine rhamnosyltransferase EarP, partial [Fluviibacter sp.]